MAKSGEIVTHPKSKHSTKPSTRKGAWRHVSQTSGQVHFVKRDKSYIELPPGPENFIVRTPYPVAPSKDDQKLK